MKSISGDAAEDARRQQSGVVTVDPPPAHGGLFGAQPEPEQVGVFGDQGAGGMAVLLRESVGVAGQDHLGVGVAR